MKSNLPDRDVKYRNTRIYKVLNLLLSTVNEQHVLKYELSAQKSVHLKKVKVKIIRYQ